MGRGRYNIFCTDISGQIVEKEGVDCVSHHFASNQEQTAMDESGKSDRQYPHALSHGALEGGFAVSVAASRSGILLVRQLRHTCRNAGSQPKKATS